MRTGCKSTTGAFSLRMLWDRAEAVSDERITVASAAETLAVPQVLQLKIYAHVPHRRTPLWTRRGVFERDDFTCARLRRAAGVTPHAILR